MATRGAADGMAPVPPARLRSRPPVGQTTPSCPLPAVRPSAERYAAAYLDGLRAASASVFMIVLVGQLHQHRRARP